MTIRSSPRSPRGVALISALIVLAILLASVSSILYFVNLQRSRAINIVRASQRVTCAEAGLKIARTFFGTNFATWNTYLANPAVYNPVASSNGFNPPATAANPRDPVFQAAHPSLFTDVDGDGQPDVYIYIRDNQDEFPPNPDNWARDNDQNVIVGAMCISKTMIPRSASGRDTQQVMAGGAAPNGLAPEALTLEGMISYNVAATGYSQSNSGDGSGNYN